MATPNDASGRTSVLASVLVSMFTVHRTALGLEASAYEAPAIAKPDYDERCNGALPGLGLQRAVGYQSRSNNRRLGGAANRMSPTDVRFLPGCARPWAYRNH